MIDHVVRDAARFRSKSNFPAESTVTGRAESRLSHFSESSDLPWEWRRIQWLKARKQTTAPAPGGSASKTLVPVGQQKFDLFLPKDTFGRQLTLLGDIFCTAC
jgi:hypothetical protein